VYECVYEYELHPTPTLLVHANLPRAPSFTLHQGTPHVYRFPLCPPAGALPESEYGTGEYEKRLTRTGPDAGGIILCHQCVVV